MAKEQDTLRTSVKLLVLSDAHFFTPQYYEHVVNQGRASPPPSRLSTELALGDEKQNPFYALILLARNKRINADALVCCGDLTTCADPTAMNLGWLQLNRLGAELGAGEPIITAGNHDVDSRFKTSQTSPQRMLKFLDPPFPTSDKTAAASYWAYGYCVIERPPSHRFVLVNTCSLHGYQSNADRHLDHGHFPDELFARISEEVAAWPAPLNILVSHHHPREIEFPSEDKSVADNGAELLMKLEQLAPPGWLVLHGHRHLPSVAYSGGGLKAPVVFSAGSLSANLHLNLQGRTANQFYILELDTGYSGIRGRYEAWTWNQHEGEWRPGESFSSLAGRGGFGYRPDPSTAASDVAAIVPNRDQGAVSWFSIEAQLPSFRYLLPGDRKPILDLLKTNHGIEWEATGNRSTVEPELLKLGRVS